MTITIQGTQVIDRPISDVFHFYADEHVKNHRAGTRTSSWKIPSGEPLRVGTVLRRQNSAAEHPYRAAWRSWNSSAIDPSAC